MKKTIHCIVLVITLTLFPSHIKPQIKLSPLNENRIKEITNIITPSNTGYGIQYQERKIWDSLYNVKKYKKLVVEAEELITQPFPEWNDSLYLIFSKKGIRPQGERMMRARSRWLPLLVWAECLENKGRFVDTIEKVLIELCKQPTWVLPAHDWHLENFKQTNPNVDLSSATQANQLAQALFLLNDKIDKDIHQIVVDKLYQRVFNPVLRTTRNLDNRHYWFTVTNNWNSVCLAGVTSAALAVIPDMKLRSEFIAMAEKYSKNGIIGYRDDGYCVEGLGYYCYGFGYYALLREAIWKATEGKIDLFNEEKIIKIATFGVRSEINNGIYPAIADCRLGSTPSPWLLWYLDNNLGLNMTEMSRGEIPFEDEPNLLTDMLVTFTNSTCNLHSNILPLNSSNLRSYFEHAGVLISRPEKQYSKDGMAVAIKGGTNNESHNHNDIGSYTIVGGNEILMGDPGGPTEYTNKTFTKERYTLYKAFSSLGHPVPLINNIEQCESETARAIILDTLFTDEQDSISMEISSAYKVKGLKTVQRQFTYKRKKSSLFSVEDHFIATKPITFETAITTRCDVKFKHNTIKIIGDKYILHVKILTNHPFSLNESTITTHGVIPFKRIGITLKNKLKEGNIKVLYSLEKK